MGMWTKDLTCCGSDENLVYRCTISELCDFIAVKESKFSNSRLLWSQRGAEQQEVVNLFHLLDISKSTFVLVEIKSHHCFGFFFLKEVRV